MAVRIPIITTFDKKGVNNALRSLDNIGAAAGKAAATLATGAAVGIAASVNEFAKFEGALQKSLAIMGDVSETMRGEMSDAARQVAKTTTFSAEEAADSFFFLASAGLTAEQSVAALPQVAAFAQAGMFDMATATDLATDAQSALGLTSDNAAENLAGLTRITDVFVKANTLANTTVEQLAEALTSKAGAALKTVGKDVEEGSAALAVFADQGIKGEKAGTLLTNTIFGLSDRVKAVPEQFEALGISVIDSSGELRNLADISDDFTLAMEDMTTEQKLATISQLGFTKQSREGLLALLGNGDALRGYEDALRSAGGTAENVADKQLQTFNGQLALLGSAAGDVALEIGSKMAPIIADLIPTIERLLPVIGDQLIAALDAIDFERLLTDITGFITFIAENIDKLDDLIVILGTVALTIGGFTTAIKIGTIAARIFGITLTTALGPIGLIGAAIGLLAGTYVAGSLAADQQSGSQEKLTEQIENTTGRIRRLKEIQEEQNNTLYAREIDKLEGQVRELKIETGQLIDFTLESVVATDAARFASQAFRDQMGLNESSMIINADGYNNIANAATNARLGVTNLIVAQEAQRAFQDIIDRNLRQGTVPAAGLYETILAKMTARIQFQTEAQSGFNDKVKQAGIDMGLVVPGFDDATTSLGNLGTATGAATTSTQLLSEEIATLNAVMADGQTANSSFLDLMNGIAEVDPANSVGAMTRELQGMIVELGKANELTSQKGGFFEFMQGGAKVTAEFDEFGNLLKSNTDSGVTAARTASGGTVDVNAINQIFNSEFGSALSDFAGGNQKVLDAIIGQQTFVNKQTGMSTTIGGNLSDEALAKILGEGFESAGSFAGSATDLEKLVTDLGDKLGLDVALGVGGIVTGPTRALIGESGPEAVIPLNRMGSMGNKNTFNISVNAGIGSDGKRIGQEIVQEILKYEKLSGKVFVRA
jgi:TP901 family phage tail tape measure protein